mgnify:CR=1 FL=1
MLIGWFMILLVSLLGLLSGSRKEVYMVFESLLERADFFIFLLAFLSNY